MIQLTCAECGAPFEIGDEFAGITEFCPVCGALNDIPRPEDAEPDPQTETTPPAILDASLQLTADPPMQARGISTPLWWTILICALSCFAAACVYFFSESWEGRNLQALNDATNRGDAYLADDDFPNAIKQYHFVLDTVDHRTIESTYITQLVDRAHHGLDDAENRLHAPPPPPPATQPAPATQPDRQIQLAIKSFQRNIEAFPSFIRAHPVVFPDDKGNWRRRQFSVWNVSYDPPTDALPLRIVLRYDCASHITDPHFSRRDAVTDDNFPHDESPRIVHCQTTFLWRSGHWLIENRTTTTDPDEVPLIDIRKSLDDLYPLEAKAFDAVSRSR